MPIKNYIIALLAPLIIVGLIPGIASWFTGNLFLLIFGIFFSAAAVGDLMIYQLLKDENRDDYVLDHPSEAGCYIYRKR